MYPLDPMGNRPHDQRPGWPQDPVPNDGMGAYWALAFIAVGIVVLALVTGV